MRVYFDTSTNELVVGTYSIPLERCQTAGQCLDWIHQVSTKTWCTPDLYKDFIDVLFKVISKDLWAGQGNKVEGIERRIELKEQELFLFVEQKYAEIKELRDRLKERRQENVS